MSRAQKGHAAPQVVPATNSRSGLGETSDGGLLDIFRTAFGAPGMPRFEAARHNFIVSEAGCARPGSRARTTPCCWRCRHAAGAATAPVALLSLQALLMMSLLEGGRGCMRAGTRWPASCCRPRTATTATCSSTRAPSAPSASSCALAATA